MSVTISGNNASLAYGSAGGPYSTSVINLKSISFSGPEVAVIPVSGVGDTADVKLPGYYDPKELSIECYHTAANKAIIGTLGTMQGWQVSLTDGSSFTSNGFLKSWELKPERNGALLYTFKVELSGDRRQLYFLFNDN